MHAFFLKTNTFADDIVDSKHSKFDQTWVVSKFLSQPMHDHRKTFYHNRLNYTRMLNTNRSSKVAVISSRHPKPWQERVEASGVR